MRPVFLELTLMVSKSEKGTDMTDTTLAPTADEIGGQPKNPRLTIDWALGTGLALGLVAIAHLLNLGLGETLLIEGPAGTPQEVLFGHIFGMTVFGATIGALLAYGSRRWTPRPRTYFLAISLVSLVGYAPVPFLAAGTTSTALWLNGFHIAVAIPVLWALSRHLPLTRPRIET
jgi:hypothetical protein